MKVFATILAVPLGLAAGVFVADYYQAIELQLLWERVPLLAAVEWELGWQVPALLSGAFLVLLAFLLISGLHLESQAEEDLPDELVLLPPDVSLPSGPVEAPAGEAVETVSPQHAQLRTSLADDLDVIEEGLRVLARAANPCGIGYRTPVGEIDLLAEDRQGGLAVMVIDDGDLARASINLLAFVGWVKAHLAAGRRVRGLLLGREIDEHTRYALSNVADIDFYKLRLRFEVERGPQLDRA